MNTKQLAACIVEKLNTDALFADRVHSSNEPFRAMHCECRIPEAALIIDGSPQYLDLVDELEQLTCEVCTPRARHVAQRNIDMYLFLDDGPQAANDARF